MERNQICKIYGTDYTEMTKRLLEAADLISLVPSRGCRIGIKPNLVAPSPASLGATTHPEVVAGIIEYLQERGCRNLVIAEGSWVGGRTQEAVEVCGYDRLSEKYGVPFHDAQRDASFVCDCKGLELHVCRVAQEIDFLINVPVLKGHCQTKMTCALKNMKGLLPNKEKRRFHAMGLHRPIAHLSCGVRQDFIVVDHICGDLDFEDGGNPVVRNCIMAARDPVLVDAYCCGLLHYKKEEIPYLVMAEELGVGSADLSCAEVGVLNRTATAEALDTGEEETRKLPCGTAEGQPCARFPDMEEKETVTLPVRLRDSGASGAKQEIRWLRGEEIWDEELPYAEKVVAVRDVVEEVDSCSACYGSLLPALDRLREEGLLDRLPDKICVGQGYRGTAGKLGVGQCTSGFMFCVKGCPPEEEEIYRKLRAYILRSMSDIF